MGEERKRGDDSVWVCEKERLGDGRGGREIRGWERESRLWEMEWEREREGEWECV